MIADLSSEWMTNAMSLVPAHLLELPQAKRAFLQVPPSLLQLSRHPFDFMLL